MTQDKPRLVILISGRGSNMQAFANRIECGDLRADIAAVVSNKAQAAGLGWAAARGLVTEVVDHTAYPSRETFDAALSARVLNYAPDLVILAGFMRILTPIFVEPLLGRLLNIHPSLLPRYPGLNTHARALDNGDTEAGATVHYVTPELDGGPAVVQARVTTRPGDTADSLAARILPLEHAIFPYAAKLHLEGRLQLTGGVAQFEGNPLPASGLDWQAICGETSPS